jgi:UDP-N-acetyl-D-glucosamine/UDP-N-acetyl-D-galactosamine dehydrogenase|tara:strand:- start:961 stop:2238 length:1278 start_codon:yes stop_codon:yes gene_type:complete
MNFKKKFKIGVLGLGYVGLPLALSFGKKFDVIGYDTNFKRIENLKKNIDNNKEATSLDFLKSKKIKFSNKDTELKSCNIFIVTVPTPINSRNIPDLKILKKASSTVGNFLKKRDIVIFESTVYPGATEEICVPILEKKSNLKFNKDFFCGYSPERINPGDKINTFENISKVVSASNKNSLKIISQLYKSVIKKNIFSAKNIKTAEAAKIIENTQRDLNISLINECSQLFKKMNINIYDVLKAAGTKWNFLNFKPGMVGGHCIGVDPYYLTYKAKKIGFNPRVILSGRKINDSMTKYIFKLINNKLSQKKKKPNKLKILIMGATFKENVSDTRNSKAIELINLLKKKYSKIDVFDPYIYDNKNQIKGVSIIKKPNNFFYDCVVIAVPHKIFKKMGVKKILKFQNNKSLFIDLFNMFEDNKFNDLTL